MNWLAHLLLAEPTPAFRVGSLLPDLLPITQLRDLPEPFQQGIARHRQIDAFTDKHPVFRRSVTRMQPPFRRYGAVLTDIFYDHMLTVHWHRYTDVSLRDFTNDVYAAFDECRDHIPSASYQVLRRMRAGVWLESYGDVDGVRITLQRMSARLRRPFDLAAATVELEAHYDALRDDFLEFFPQAMAQFNAQLVNAQRTDKDH